MGIIHHKMASNKHLTWEHDVQTLGASMDSIKKMLSILIVMLAGLNAAQADDWGCQVLLCLANPGGPTQYAACVPPITRLWDALSHGGAFPTCAMASGGAGGASYAQQLYTHYDHCPVGTNNMPQGISAVRQSDLTASQRWGSRFTLGTMYSIPMSSIYSYGYNSDGMGMNSYEDGKYCVANHQGEATVCPDMTNCAEGGAMNVTVYGTLIAQQPHPSGNAIDVYIDNTWHNRVFW
jgi:hypothetical protein